MGRFINGDVFTSTGQGLLGNNMFAYCLNNPINYHDPYGELALIDDLAVLGMVTLFMAAFIVVTMPPPPVFTATVPTFEFPSLVITEPFEMGTSITEARTKGNENVKDTGLQGLSDAEVSSRARDKKLPKSERQRYKKEEKGRGIRNKQKRNAHFFEALLW